MSAPDRPGPAGEDLLADRLENLFTAVKGPRAAPATPPAPGPATPGTATPPPPPPGAGKPERDQRDTPAGTALPEVDVVRLIRYLDAQLELTRKEAREGLEAVLAAVQALDQRVGAVETSTPAAADADLSTRLEEIAKALFDWFETFAEWQASRFDRLDRLTGQLLSGPSQGPEEGVPSPG